MTPDQFWDDVSDAARPPVLLPDIGTFFNQDMSLASQMILAVHSHGANYLKGELLHDPDICLATETTEQYLGHDAQPIRENYRRLIDRKAVPLKEYERIFEPCDELGMGLVLSVYDIAGAEFAARMGACALKIASTNVVHAPLIRHCAQLGLPILLDSGKSSFDEITRAIQWAREAGAERLILEYSPPAPPAPIAGHNLRVLEFLASVFDGPLGLSDHHAGEEMLYAATALGCRVLEKGVCTDAAASDQDIFHALPLGRLNEVTTKYRNIHAALGDADMAFRPPEQRPAARMGVTAATDLSPGERVRRENVRFAFPTLGVPVEDWDRLEGRAVTRPIGAGQPLQWSDVDDGVYVDDTGHVESAQG